MPGDEGEGGPEFITAVLDLILDGGGGFPAGVGGCSAALPFHSGPGAGVDLVGLGAAVVAEYERALRRGLVIVGRVDAGHVAADVHREQPGAIGAADACLQAGGA